ncbi:MAG: non-ribosomal peptide synthetase, partial [Thermoleophilia bacterium]|nr:non-ribosomal peptide synthetase [Thermoleophilia bacterium]
DPSTPPDRVAYILKDAGAPLVLTHRGKGRALPAGPWRAVVLDGPEALTIAERPDDAPATPRDPEAIAYVVYTSGSTGHPKGVDIRHRNLDNLIAWHCGSFEITPDDRASQVAGLAFDPTAWEIWPNLAAGASVHVADDLTRRSPSSLRDWLVAERISVAFAPTVMAELLLDEAWPADGALRLLLTGGEALKRRPHPGTPFRLVNCYGPAECTVVVSCTEVPPDPHAEGPPTIGRAIPGVTALVLDEHLAPVPDGVAGELCFAGESVGRGYRNRPDLTAERFVDVAAAGAPTRVYRTGDRARFLPSGELEFLGRSDDQVKIRGYRIEPGEVVAALAAHPTVATAAVIAIGEGMTRALAAYVVPAKGARPTVKDLRAHLSARLADFMVPAHFVGLDALPMTVNGKVDRAKLPEPGPANVLPLDEAEAESPPAPAEVAAGDGVEARIGAMVAALLSRSAVGRDDNFFLLGGHSMMGVQLVAKIRDAFGVKLTLRQLFQAPTVAALSAEVARLSAGH